MKSFQVFAALAALTIAALGVAAAQEKSEPKAPPQEMPPAPEKLEQHQWLQKLVGEWTGAFEVTMAPGAAPERMETTETIRSLGGLWIVAEGKSEMMGQPMTSMMTLGYDPVKKMFIGTWVDSMQTHMWTYTGTLDEAKKVLTLSAEGPSWEDPTKIARYRDAIEIISPDAKRLTSSIEGPDGKWVQFMKADYQRKK